MDLGKKFESKIDAHVHEQVRGIEAQLKECYDKADELTRELDIVEEYETILKQIHEATQSIINLTLSFKETTDPAEKILIGTQLDQLHESDDETEGKLKNLRQQKEIVAIENNTSLTAVHARVQEILNARDLLNGKIENFTNSLNN